MVMMPKNAVKDDNEAEQDQQSEGTNEYYHNDCDDFRANFRATVPAGVDCRQRRGAIVARWHIFAASVDTVTPIRIVVRLICTIKEDESDIVRVIESASATFDPDAGYGRVVTGLHSA